METPLKTVLTILMFWIVFGGMLQIFGFEDNNTSQINPDTSQSYSSFFSKLSFLWDMMTFDIEGIPSGLRTGLNVFFTGALTLSIYVFLRGQ